jgi:hypothetical protein
MVISGFIYLGIYYCCWCKYLAREKGTTGSTAETVEMVKPVKVSLSFDKKHSNTGTAVSMSIFDIVVDGVKLNAWLRASKYYDGSGHISFYRVDHKNAVRVAEIVDGEFRSK